MGEKEEVMDNNKNATGNTAPTPAPQQDEEAIKKANEELMKMKLAYTQFEAEKVKNRSFGEKLVESIPYILGGVALAGSGVAIGVSIKALNETTKVLNETRAQIGYLPSPDGDLE